MVYNYSNCLDFKQLTLYIGPHKTVLEQSTKT